MTVPPTSSSKTSSSDTQIDTTAFTSQMSQKDFLKLLVAQMTAQNPLSPTENQDLLGQMVQMSTLQQNNNMQKAISSMQTSQELLQANTMLGRQITLQTTDNIVTGVATGVQLDSGTARIVVDGKAYDLSQVISISNPSTNP
jgi:flagellar basal-body rod modification protein FlgD